METHGRARGAQTDTDRAAAAMAGSPWTSPWWWSLRPPTFTPPPPSPSGRWGLHPIPPNSELETTVPVSKGSSQVYPFPHILPAYSLKQEPHFEYYFHLLHFWCWHSLEVWRRFVITYVGFLTESFYIGHNDLNQWPSEGTHLLHHLLRTAKFFNCHPGILHCESDGHHSLDPMALLGFAFSTDKIIFVYHANALWVFFLLHYLSKQQLQHSTVVVQPACFSIASECCFQRTVYFNIATYSSLPGLLTKGHCL